MAAGISEIVEHPDEQLTTAIAGLMFGGVALYLLTFNYSRWQMFRMLSPTRSAAGVVVLLLIPLALRVPGLLALATLAAVAIGLNLWEYRRFLAAQRTDPAGVS
jgi:low temperature requirement protein LtrA